MCCFFFGGGGGAAVSEPFIVRYTYNCKCKKTVFSFHPLSKTQVVDSKEPLMKSIQVGLDPFGVSLIDFICVCIYSTIYI